VVLVEISEAESLGLVSANPPEDALGEPLPRSSADTAKGDQGVLGEVVAYGPGTNHGLRGDWRLEGLGPAVFDKV